MARKPAARKPSSRSVAEFDDDEYDDDEYEDRDEAPSQRGKNLKTLLAPGQLREYGWDRSFERGEAYYRTGAVTSLVQNGVHVSAAVQGTRKYKTHIWLEDGRLRSACTCPAGGFCKHLIATALAWNKGEAEVLGDLDDIAAPNETASVSKKKGKKIALRAHLLSLDKEALADMLLEQAARDGELRERLNLSAAVANPDGVDLASLRQRIDCALALPDFDYDNPYWDDGDPYEGYTDQMKPVLAALKTLLGKGQAAPVAALAEYALAELNKQCLEMEYDFVDPEAMVDPLVALHVQACAKTKPNPLAVADWLFRLGVRDTADNFGGLPWKRYTPVLGATGMARFRQLVEAEWARIPALKARDEHDPHRRLRSRLQEIVMQFAREDGDVDAQAAAAKKDLSHSPGYLAVAKIYQSAKRYDEALEWAEKGWKTFLRDGYGRNPELRDLLAREYRRKRRNAEAMELYWSEFSERPCLARYQELKKQAEKEKAWPSWRDKAFIRIRELIAVAKKKRDGLRANSGGWAPRYYGADYGADQSLVVEILLWENRPEEAWREAVEGGCSEDWWLKLSALREKERPEDCVPIWRKRVDRLTRDANQGDYKPAAESLVKLGALMKRIGAEQEFTEYVRAMRDDLRRRRNFIRELDKHKLP